MKEEAKIEVVVKSLEGYRRREDIKLPVKDYSKK
jgi:hypothetical protein